MPHMEPEVISGRGYEVETTGGTFFIPALLIEESKLTGPVSRVARILMEYAPEGVMGGKHVSHEEIRGYFYHLTAPGYLDQTDWEFAKTRQELQEGLDELEGDDDDDDEDDGGYCERCGEPYPCSDSQRRDINPLERALHVRAYDD